MVLDTFKISFNPKTMKDITKYSGPGYEIVRKLFRGRDTYPICVSRESYFKNAKFYTAQIFMWSHLRDLFDIVNQRCINMDNLETTISVDESDRTESLLEKSNIIIPFVRLSKYYN